MADATAGQTPASIDLRINKGETFDTTLTYKNDAGTAINLTGYTARAYIRTAYGAADPPTVNLSTTNGRITLGGSAGTIRMQMAETITDAISAPSTTGDATTYVWDLELVSGSSVVTVFAKGQVRVYPSVTTGA